MQSIFLGHTGMKLEIDTRNESMEFTSMQKLNSTLVNNQEITREFGKYCELNENENILKSMYSSSSAQKKFIDANAYIKKKISNQLLNHLP